VSAEGAKIEAPRGVSAGRGVPLPLGEGAVLCPLPRKILNFKNKNDVFWCTLKHGFYT